MKKGFTLVELLISVGLIVILSGVTLNIINVGKKRAQAEDSVLFSNLEKIILGVDSYYASEGSYPPDLASASTYLQSTPSPDYVYTLLANGYYIYVVKKDMTPSIYKHHSSWTNIKTCYSINDRTSPGACVLNP